MRINEVIFPAFLDISSALDIEHLGESIGDSQLGPFYELETSSPAALLEPGKTIAHAHNTVRMTSEMKELNEIAKKALGVSLEEIEAALP